MAVLRLQALLFMEVLVEVEEQMVAELLVEVEEDILEVLQQMIGIIHVGEMLVEVDLTIQERWYHQLLVQMVEAEVILQVILSMVILKLQNYKNYENR